MNRWGDYFFCGVGGSGMTPLALIVQARGGRVEGSDRALDQGRDAAKFDFLRARGVRLHPQDGSGVRRADQILVTSAAVEDTVPDVQAARRIGAAVTTRARLLAELFNASGCGIGVAGTSGKSTTTGMIGWILHRAGRNPTIMNGAEMKNFISVGSTFAAARIGDGEEFVCEVDESDGSIALFAPRVAVVNNISLDHKPLDELRTLFRGFVCKGETVVLNLDNTETAALVTDLKPGKVLTWSLSDTTADLLAGPPVCSPGGIAFPVKARASGQVVEVTLKVPGLHNLANALAALSATIACGVGLADAAKHLEEFSGIRRRLEVVGTANEITVIDDFAHNPDKIAATLQTMHAFAGRLLLMFQPHGYGPLRLMRDNLVDCFACGLRSEDVLLMPEPVYFGGTVDRSVGSGEIVGEIVRRGRKALALPDRSACGEKLVQLARRGDRILVMGARDDSLSQFARDLVQRVERIGKV
ncbi:MAG: UDP-N-acetylmuramate--alanine ligase [Alphaproteobacteria bacterium]|nr:MAG: UDP-N-acetylmuramate--alanine ligase [Alphaproteobacteria bacterium]